MSDLFGFTETPPRFVDIRNTRDSVAEEKARLCKALNELLRRVPKSINGGSVNLVRKWQVEHKASKKTLEDKRSSVQQLQSAINRMQAYE